MNGPKKKSSIIFLGLVGVFLAAAVFIILSAAIRGPERSAVAQPAPSVAPSDSFDANSGAIFTFYDHMVDEYLVGGSSERTLAEYYSRRQYPGSPPQIPHPLTDIFGEEDVCLACHEHGGYAEEMKRHAPITPHPELSSCRQCHVTIKTDTQFTEIDWQSVAPPRLGNSQMPGSPPTIPHSLQMRGNCPACHVGPGTVSVLRVEHASRGNCRQCHVPETDVEPFNRSS